MPLGPREVLRMLHTALAARMFAFCASSPLTRPLVSPSLMMMNGRPYSSKARLRGERSGRGERYEVMRVSGWCGRARGCRA
eukprot:scaffold322009_cov28-Tisochrysis_lutea.AAC.1